MQRTVKCNVRVVLVDFQSEKRLFFMRTLHPVGQKRGEKSKGHYLLLTSCKMISCNLCKRFLFIKQLLLTLIEDV